MRRLTATVLALLLCLSGASCAPAADSAPAYTIVNEATLTPGDPVPAPADEVVLTVEGAIDTTNTNGQLDFDLETLEEIGVVEYTVEQDPYANRSVTYQGVLLEDVLAVAEMHADATMLHALAIDDYTVDIPVDVTRWPVMIATREDGERIAVADKGPIKIVFPYSDFDIDQATYNPMWVWHLRLLEVQ